jgi:hypothetical protein
LALNQKLAIWLPSYQIIKRFFDKLKLSVRNNSDFPRGEGKSYENGIYKKAGILGLDIDGIAEQTAKNRKANYGVTLVAGHPMSGSASEVLKKWAQEISEATGGKLEIKAETVHSTIGAMLRSQDTPIDAKDFVNKESGEAIDLGKAMTALAESQGYRLTFKGVELNSKDGNLVIRAEVSGGRVEELRQKLAETGFNFKYKPKSGNDVYITLGHVNSEMIYYF